MISALVITVMIAAYRYALMTVMTPIVIGNQQNDSKTVKTTTNVGTVCGVRGD